MHYLAASLNHFKAIQNWLRSSEAEASLNPANFELEVRCRQRYYNLFPQFLTQRDGHYIYSSTLDDNVTGFIGWLPYRPVSWAPANDKLVFKKFIQQHSERTPRFWDLKETPLCDYIIKSSSGSFGNGLIGPLQANQSTSLSTSTTRGATFAEEFIQGDILKVWFWGKQPVYAQKRIYPEILCDGKSTVRKLLQDRLLQTGRDLNGDDPDYPTLFASIQYQRRSLDETPEKGVRIWMDYRYGRNYALSATRTRTDSALSDMPSSLIEQILRVGEKVHEEVLRQFSAPLLFSIDAVIDSKAQIWWLEANSNPTLPPDGYPHIFSSLFGTPVPATDAPSLHEMISITV